MHESHLDDKIHTIEELFPVGCQCFMLASPYYGASGEVIEIDVKQSRIRVQLLVPVEPDLSSIIDQHQVRLIPYDHDGHSSNIFLLLFSQTFNNIST